MNQKPNPHPAVRPVEPSRISTAGGAPAPVTDPGEIIVEAPLTIDINGVAAYTVMCAPSGAVALAVGFLFAEGIIDSLDDIGILNRCPDDPGVIRVQLTDPARAKDTGRNLLITSSCGLCGSQSVDDVLAGLPTVGEGLVVPAASLRLAVEAMHERQSLFRRTGGAHAAALFGRGGRLVAFAEDIGRHNALDKAIGACLLERRSPAGHGVALSGRVSLEMVGKCARAGIEIIAAVSAPTSLALDAAERCDITLCAFVRDHRATVYCHPKRILNMS